jgi:nitrate reductase cytochrome c-type subunit
MHIEDSRYLCTACYGGYVPLGRYRLGYSTCLPCGDLQAKQVKHTIAPINKSNYMHISDMNILKQLNPKRTM